MEVDVVITGGSVAGSYMANLLAESGLRTLIIDKEQMPRFKACGEGMAALAAKYLSRIGIEIPSQNSFYGYQIQFKNTDNIQINQTKLKDRKPAGFFVLRSALDEKLQKYALSHSTVSYLNARVLNSIKSKDGWKVKTDKAVVKSKFFVSACGTAISKIIPEIKYTKRAFADNDRCGMAFWVKGSWEESKPASVLIKNINGTQVIITPIEENRVNVSILISKSKEIKKTRSDLINLGLSFLKESGFHLIKIQQLKGANDINSRVARNIPPEVYLIGDSAEVFDPVGGLGMLHAFTSATLAANSIIEANTSKFKKFAWFKYRMRREIYALRMSLINNLSYFLNVKEIFLLKALIKTSPETSYKILSLLKKVFLGREIKFNGSVKASWFPVQVIQKAYMTLIPFLTFWSRS